MYTISFSSCASTVAKRYPLKTFFIKSILIALILRTVNFFQYLTFEFNNFLMFLSFLDLNNFVENFLTLDWAKFLTVLLALPPSHYQPSHFGMQLLLKSSYFIIYLMSFFSVNLCSQVILLNFKQHLN